MKLISTSSIDFLSFTTSAISSILTVLMFSQSHETIFNSSATQDKKKLGETSAIKFQLSILINSFHHGI
jgi:hypothetical protein